VRVRTCVHAREGTRIAYIGHGRLHHSLRCAPADQLETTGPKGSAARGIPSRAGYRCRAAWEMETGDKRGNAHLPVAHALQGASRVAQHVGVRRCCAREMQSPRLHARRLGAPAIERADFLNKESCQEPQTGLAGVPGGAGVGAGDQT
jgi:hypothetical protein